MRLLRVELNRLFSRRAVVLLVLAAALLTALLAATTLYDTRPVSAADMSRAQARAEEQRASPGSRRELENCLADPTTYFGPDATDAACQDALVPRAEFFLDRAPLSLAEETGDSGIAVVVLVTALLVIAGTTFAGADWASGSMSNQLLFEPRRRRIWTAKALAVLLASALVAGTLVAGFWLALWLTAEARGLSTPGPVLQQVGWAAARGVALAAAGGLGGFALTMLLRHTVGTLAVLFAYTVIGEAVVTILPIERAPRFSLATNVFAWIRDGLQVYDPRMRCPPSRAGCDQTFLVSSADAATYLGVLLLVVMVLSAVSFQRRDVP